MSKKFHGWKVVFVCFIMMFTLYPSLFTSLSIYTRPICDQLGFSASQFLLHNTVKAIFTVIGTLYVHKMVGKFGAKNTIVIGLAFAIVSLIGYSISSTLFMFYFFSAFMGIGLAFTCMVIPGIVITNWFNEKRGSAMGLALSGSGIGGSFYSPIATLVIKNFGWRQAFIFTAIFIVLVTLTTVLLLFKEKPELMGQKPYGESKSLKLYGCTSSKMLSTPIFYTFAISILLVNIVANGLSINYASYFEYLGYDAIRASMFLSLGLFSVTLGKLVMGVTLDKLGSKNTGLINGIILTIQCLFLLKAVNVVPAAIFSLFYGLTAASCSILPPIYTEEFFGNLEFGKKFGIMAMLMSLSNALAPIVSDVAYRISKVQEGVIYVYIVLGFIYLIAIYFTFKLKKEPNREELRW